jgi:hypothetical protein
MIPQHCDKDSWDYQYDLVGFAGMVMNVTEHIAFCGDLYGIIHFCDEDVVEWAPFD